MSEIIHRNNISLHRKHSSVSHVSQSRAEPVSAGDLGAARDAAGVRDGSLSSAVPKADRLGCDLRQPVGGRDGWPRAGGGEGVRR